MTIYLIGYMCSGKTTLGGLLKDITKVTFTDLDQYIEEKEGCSINEIFSRKGEEEFRKIERASLREVSENIGGIIATGGGTPCFFDNMEYMKSNGCAIYLSCSREELVERLKIYKATRPLLKDKSDRELKEFIENSLPKREPFYNKATIIIDADPLSTEKGAIETAKKFIEIIDSINN
ncbi:MAG: shikimate kinase [Bacteroidales bacterium]|nr:shikimate kinase [Bacteroidales bacterium]